LDNLQGKSMDGAKQVFISYSGINHFEASLLQYAVESKLKRFNVKAWTYKRDQALDERDIAQSLKARVKESIASLFIISPESMENGQTQWVELGYSDAFDIKTFILLHRIKYSDLQAGESKAPPLLVSSQCSPASKWEDIILSLETLIEGE